MTRAQPNRAASWLPNRRWLVAAALLGPWLLFLTTRQTALYPPAPTPAVELVPTAVTIGAIIVAVALRLALPGTLVHGLFLTVLTGGVALGAAQLGIPLANAAADYCGDFCRSAIFGRFLTFFGWPIATSLAIGALARREARPPADAGSLERAAWSRAFAAVVLFLGLGAGTLWWGIILPNGSMGPPGPY